MRSALVTVFVLVALSLWSRPALASGSFGTRFGSREFIVQFEEHVRKIFIDDAQAQGHYARKLREFHLFFLAALPRLRALMARARARGLRVLDLRLDAPLIDAENLPATRVPAAGSAPQAPPRRFPASVGFAAEVQGGTFRIFVTLAQPPTRAEVEAVERELAATLAAAAAAQAEAEPDPSEPLPPEAQAATAELVDPRFGLAVGSDQRLAAADVAHFRRQLEPLRRRALAALRAKLDDASWRRGFGGELLEVAPVLAAQGRALDLRAFNPSGPAVDGGDPAVMRLRRDVGAAYVIVLVAIRGQDRWGDVYRQLDALLGPVLDPPRGN